MKKLNIFLINLTEFMFLYIVIPFLWVCLSIYLSLRNIKLSKTK